MVGAHPHIRHGEAEEGVHEFRELVRVLGPGTDEALEVRGAQGLVRDRDYYEESKLRDRPESISGPNYDRVRIVKAQAIAYVNTAATK